VSHTAGKS